MMYPPRPERLPIRHTPVTLNGVDLGSTVILPLFMGVDSVEVDYTTDEMCVTYAGKILRWFDDEQELWGEACKATGESTHMTCEAVQLINTFDFWGI